MVKLLFYHFRVTNSRIKNKNFHFELLTQSWKIKSFTSSYQLGLSFYFSTFELLTRTWKILNYTSSYWPNPGFYWKFFFLYPLSAIKRKLVYFFWSTTTSNYLYIINRYCCSQFSSQFSVIVVLVFRDTQKHSLMERKKKIIFDSNKI